MMTSMGGNRARGNWEQTQGQTQSQTQHKQRPQVSSPSPPVPLPRCKIISTRVHFTQIECCQITIGSVLSVITSNTIFVADDNKPCKGLWNKMPVTALLHTPLGIFEYNKAKNMLQDCVHHIWQSRGESLILGFRIAAAVWTTLINSFTDLVWPPNITKACVMIVESNKVFNSHWWWCLQ